MTFVEAVTQMQTKSVTWRIILISVLAFWAGGSHAQDGKEGYLGALELKQARIRFEDAKARFDRARLLHEEKIISEQQLREEETRFLLTQVELARTFAGFVQSQPQIVIGKATKYQTENGRKRVRLTLVNRAAESNREIEALESLEEWGSLDWTAVQSVRNVVVSLRTAAGYRDGVLLEPTIISDPYETPIARLDVNEPVVVDVGLLMEDVSEIVVAIDYGGRTEHKQILLRKDSSGNPISFSALQTSLVADLGGDAIYNLVLERFSSGVETFRVAVEDAPAALAVELLDSATDARLRQVFFAQDVTTRRLSLKVTLPEKETLGVRPNEPLKLMVAAVADADPSITESLELELVPRGVGKLEVEAINLYHEVPRGEPCRFELSIRNTGSLDVERVTLDDDVPYGWRTEVEPKTIDRLSPGDEEKLQLNVVPLSNAPFGEYEIRMRFAGMGDNRLIETETKSFRINLKASTNLAGRIILLGGLGLLVAGMIVFGVRLSRR